MLRSEVSHIRSDGSSRWTRLTSTIQRFRSPPPAVRGVLLVVAATGTLVAVVVSARALDLQLATLRTWPLLLAVALTPAVIALNAAELRAMTRIVGTTPGELPWLPAARTTTLATAANLLPVPAGALLRVQVMRSYGASLSNASGITVASAALWVSLSTFIAGMALLAIGAEHTTIAAYLALAGSGALAAVGVAFTRRLARPRPSRLTMRLIAIETSTAILHSVRLYLVLLGLNEAAGLLQGLAIGASTPLAAAAGFFPGGLGLAELLSALLGPLAQVSAAAALLATAVTRVLGLALIVPAALALGLGDMLPDRRSRTRDLDQRHQGSDP